jgi:carbamoyltransferase
MTVRENLEMGAYSKKSKIKNQNSNIKTQLEKVYAMFPVLKEREKDYIVNPKNVAAPYMIMTFDTTELAQKDIIAAVHPYDFTARPQLVEKEWNPDYYEILKCYENITGVGGFLNTSFNLHGLPIAMTPADAMHVFENSSLKYLAMGNWLVSK